MRRPDYEDLRRVVWLSAPALSPDGEMAAYVRAESDYQTGQNIPQVWEIPTGGGDAAPVSRATSRQTAPAYSPDGRWLAYLSDDTGVSQLWLKDRHTGREYSPLRLRHGVSAMTFSPDGRRIAFVTKTMTDRTEDISAEMTAEELAAFCYEQKHAPKIAENLIYKFDESYGFIEKSRSLVGVLDIASGEWKMVSPENIPCEAPSFGKDCLYFYGRPYRHEKELQYALYRLADGCTEAEEMTNEVPVYAPVPMTEHEGAPVYIGMHVEGDSWLAEPYAVGRGCLFTGDEPCHGVDQLMVGDCHMGSMGQPWQQGDDGCCFLAARNGIPGVWRWMEGAVQPLVQGTIIAFAAPRNGRIVYLRSRFNHPAELYAIDLASGTERRLTHENDWAEEIAFRQPVELNVPTRDGKASIHGFVLLPDGQERCPGVLYLHGGPTAFTVGDGFYFDAQMLAAQGMAVFYCDPRGSAGYGRVFMSSQCAWGEEAMNDAEDFMDEAIARFPRIDVSRLGVTGGSYGGYLTCKMILQRKRFKAAVAQRTFVNPATSYGTGDIGFISGSGKTDFRQYMLDRARQSMLKDIRNLTIPLLVLHGENDLRCGVEQADQLFVLMRAIHPEVPAKLVIFPGENHGVNRDGLMHNQIRHCRELAEWLKQYLKEGDARDEKH